MKKSVDNIYYIRYTVFESKEKERGKNEKDKY